MASRDQLKALIRSHFEQNEAQFMSVAMQVAASEARRGHGKLAEELREMIYAAKLRLIFDAVGDHRAVYFFDEFDAIASQRGLGNDVGEIRRVLNSFLQLIEQDESTSLIVAATNHPEILDYAAFRRFDDVIEYELPGPLQIAETLGVRVGGLADRDVDWDALAEAAGGLSYADITRAADEAVKEAIIAEQRSVTGGVLIRALDERRTIQS